MGAPDVVEGGVHAAGFHVVVLQQLRQGFRRRRQHLIRHHSALRQVRSKSQTRENVPAGNRGSLQQCTVVPDLLPLLAAVYGSHETLHPKA